MIILTTTEVQQDLLQQETLVAIIDLITEVKKNTLLETATLEITEAIQDLLTALLVVILHHLEVLEVILLETIQVQEAIIQEALGDN